MEIKRILGISEGYHDAGVALIQGRDILYASHSEMYSGKKNDKSIHPPQQKRPSIHSGEIL